MKILLPVFFFLSFAASGQTDTIDNEDTGIYFNQVSPKDTEDIWEDWIKLDNSFLSSQAISFDTGKSYLDFIILLNEDSTIEVRGDTMKAIRYLIKELTKAKNKVYEYEYLYRRKK